MRRLSLPHQQLKAISRPNESHRLIPLAGGCSLHHTIHDATSHIRKTALAIRTWNFYSLDLDYVEGKNG